MTRLAVRPGALRPGWAGARGAIGAVRPEAATPRASGIGVGRAGPASGPARLGHPAGDRTVKRVPRPGSLSTAIVPSWPSTMPQVTASPSPVPRVALGGEERLEQLVQLLGRDAAARVLHLDLRVRLRPERVQRLAARPVTALARAPLRRAEARHLHAEHGRAALPAAALRHLEPGAARGAQVGWR